MGTDLMQGAEAATQKACGDALAHLLNVAIVRGNPSLGSELYNAVGLQANFDGDVTSLATGEVENDVSRFV